jgi:hypothetical protein
MPNDFNPYVEAASGAAGAASSNLAAGLRYVTALRSAAAQQQQLQQQQDLEYKKEVMGLQEKGYTPAEKVTGGTLMTGGLGQRVPNPDIAGQKGTNVTDTRGSKWFKANPTAEEKLDNSNSVPMGQLAQQLEDAGVSGYKAEDRVKPDIYKSLSDRMNPKEKAGAKHLRVDTEHFNQPVLMDEDTGEVKALKLGEGITHNAPKPEKTPKTTYRYEVQDNGSVSRFPNEEDGVPQTWNGKAWVTAGAQVGPQRKDPNAPQPPSKPRLEQIKKAKDERMSKAEEEFSKTMRGFTRKKDGGLYPQDMPAAQEARQTLEKELRSAQDDFESSLGIELGHDVEHYDISQRKGGPAAPQGSVQAGGQQNGPPSKSASPVTKQGAPAKPGSKGTASLGQIQRYAKQKGISLTQGVNEFKGAGYTVAGQ